MRLLSYQHRGNRDLGVRRGERVIPVRELDPAIPNELRALLAADGLEEVADRADSYRGEGLPLADIVYDPLIGAPGKLLCIGRNYAAHAAEGGAAVPEFPEVFMRGPTTLLGHGDELLRPRCSYKFDYEGEIAVIIGSACRHASEAEALQYVAGYSLFQDATLRDYQKRSSQWTLGKNFDATGAFGPELVTADELPAGAAGLKLQTRLNGEQMQEGKTDQLIFPVAVLIAMLSEVMTLQPGDVISTGTPSGVGFARKPPVWLQPGDQVEVEVEGIGTLANGVRAEV